MQPRRVSEPKKSTRSASARPSAVDGPVANAPTRASLVMSSMATGRQTDGVERFVTGSPSRQGWDRSRAEKRRKRRVQAYLSARACRVGICREWRGSREDESGFFSLPCWRCRGWARGDKGGGPVGQGGDKGEGCATCQPNWRRPGRRCAVATAGDGDAAALAAVRSRRWGCPRRSRSFSP